MTDPTPFSPTPDPAPRRSPGWTWSVNQLMFVVVLAAVALVLIRQFAWLLLIFLVTVSPLLLVVGVVVTFIRRRSTQQEGLLSVMAIAAERGMPVGPGLDAFADLCAGSIRRKAIGMAYLLESGTPFQRAMETVPGLLPRPADVLAGVGARVGNLGAALRDAQASIASRNAYRRSTAPRIAYLCAVLMAMQTISAFVLYFIAPKFEAIFRDFGQPLPDLTAAVIQAGWWIAPLLPLLFLAELAVLAYIGLSQAGLLAWEPPGWNRLYRRRDTATILRSLALAIEVDRPVTEVFELLSRSYPVRWIRGRLAHVAVRVEEGAAWTEAMMGQGLLSRNDAAVLDAASRAGNLPWALRTVADSNERRLGYRLAAMAQWVFPVVIAGLGLLVLLFAMAYFAPLISLIRSLAA